MPVQIPTIQRGNAPEPQTVGRVQGDTSVDTRFDVSEVRGAMEHLAVQGVDTASAIEQQADATAATKGVNEYNQYFKSKFYGDPSNGTVGIKEQKGDPTPIYNAFTSDLSAKAQEIMGDPSLSSSAKDLLGRQLSLKANELDMQKLSAYGYQHSKYLNDNMNAGLKLEADGMVVNAGLVKPGDEGSFEALDQNVARMRKLIIENGMSNGAVKPDANGNAMYVDDKGQPTRVSTGPAVDFALKTNLSNGIYSAIDNAIKSGSLETAQAIKERYSDLLDPVNHKAFEDEYQKANLKQKASDAADKASLLPPDQQINSLKKLDPLVRDQAEQILDDRGRREQNIKERASKANYDSLMNNVIQRQNSNNPFNGRTELEADQTFKQMIDKVTDPKQKQALYDAVDQPKESNPKALAHVMSVMRGDDPNVDPRNMSPTDIQQTLSGLSKTDRTYYERQIGKAGTQGANFQSTQRALSILKQEAARMGVIRFDNDDGKDVKKNGEQDLKLGQLTNDFAHALDKSGPLKSYSETLDEAHKFLLSQQNGTVYKGPARFQATGPAFAPPAQSAAPTPTPQSAVQGRAKALKDFSNINGRQPNASELNNFIQQDKSGRYK